MEATRQLRRQKLLKTIEHAPILITPEYQEKSDKVLDYLMDSVATEPGIKIRGCETAAEAWKVLKDIPI